VDQQVLREVTTPTNTSLRLVESESTDKSKKNVLCTLEGPFADFTRETRNGRKYERALWEKVLSSPHVKEMLATRTFFGEIDHPYPNENRLEVSLQKVSHCITDIWINDATGTVDGRLDILDTPSGRILKTLIDYGSKLGISSRGAGRVINRNGESVVDPDSYQFVTFDIVPLPANERSRLEEVNLAPAYESTKLVDKLSAQVEEVIRKNDKYELEAVYTVLESVNLPELKPLCERVQQAIEGTSSVVADTANDLREAYRTITELRNRVKDLEQQVEEYKSKAESNSGTYRLDEAMEKLFNQMAQDLSEVKAMVSEQGKLIDDKVTVEKLEFELDQLRNQIETKNEEVQFLRSRIEKLLKEIEQKDDLIAELDDTVEELNDSLEDLEQAIEESQNENAKLKEAQKSLVSKVASLEEQLAAKEEQEQKLLEEKEQLENLVSTKDEEIEGLLSENSALKEQLDQVQDEESAKDKKIKVLESRIKSLEEQVKEADKFIMPYIKLRCSQLGLDPRSVTSNLISENITFDRVESVLKELADRKIKLNDVPISLDESLAFSGSAELEKLETSVNSDLLASLIRSNKVK